MRGAIIKSPTDLVIGLAAVPGAFLFQAAWRLAGPSRGLQTLAVCLLIAPAYVIFAIGMMFLIANFFPWFSWGVLWPLILVAIGLLIVLSVMRRRQ